MHVVVHGHPRVPLAQLVEARAHATHAPAAVGRNREVPGDVERHAEVGRERPRQLHPHHRAEHLRRQRPSTNCEAIDCDSAGESLAAEVEDHPAGEQQRRLVQRRGDRAGREQILIELHPDVVEGIRRAVDVIDAALAAQGVRRRIERRVERIVGALLPVVWPRRSRRAARRRR